MTANPSKPGDKGSRIRSSEARRSKPEAERRRRLRINQSLSILKTLIVDTSREKPPSKLEKADILEFTVQYLQKNQTADLDEQKFTEGYQECTKAALKFLESCNIDQSTLEKLVEFLKFRRQSTNQILCDDKTNNTIKWESLSKTRKNISSVEDNRLKSGFDSESSTSILHSSPLTSKTFLDLQFIDSISLEIPSPDAQISDRNETSFPSDLLNKLPESFTVHLPSTPTILKAIQISPVDLSRDVRKTYNSSCYFNNTNSSNPFSTSSSYENFDDVNKPLDLCCKYSSMYEEQGVWRPW